MDKQKQIEEMAKVMCECCIENEEFTCSIVPQPCIFAKTFAETIHKKGYRKIPEGAVMLTKEELAEKLKLSLDNRLYVYSNDDIDEICKEITEG